MTTFIGGVQEGGDLELPLRNNVWNSSEFLGKKILELLAIPSYRRCEFSR